MGKSLKDILIKTIKIGIVSTVLLGSLNKIFEVNRFSNLKDKYVNEIMDITKSPLVARYLELGMNMEKNSEGLKNYFKKIDKDWLKGASEHFKKESGYILQKDMQTVSQKKLDSSFEFEYEWNMHMSSMYNKKYSDAVLKKMLDISIKNSSKNYVKEMINVENPEDAMSELIFMRHGSDKSIFGVEDFSASFRRVHENKIDDCDGGAIYAAGALSDNGFIPYELILRDGDNKKNDMHALFIYKTDEGNFGTLGINDADMLYPRYNSIEKLVSKINEGMRTNYTEYEIYDLKKAFPDFLDNNKNNDPTIRYHNPISICED